uniref:ORF2 n=1 Tax=Euplotes crassus TaxID=5936 RepID=V9GZN4_EUPCR|nr:ORF2 [Moneuplotes crassus]
MQTRSKPKKQENNEGNPFDWLIDPRMNPVVNNMIDKAIKKRFGKDFKVVPNQSKSEDMSDQESHKSEEDQEDVEVGHQQSSANDKSHPQQPMKIKVEVDFPERFYSKMDEFISIYKKMEEKLNGKHTSIHQMPIMDDEPPEQDLISASAICDIAEENKSEEHYREEYPFETFLKERYPKLTKKNKMKYNRLKREVGGNDAVAFYLYIKDVGRPDSRKSLGSIFNKFLEANVPLNYMDVYEHFSSMDGQQKNYKTYVAKHYYAVKRVLVHSYGLDPKRFYKPKFKSNTRISARKMTIAPSKQFLLNVWNELYSDGHLMEALVIHLMFSLALRPNEVGFLSFDRIKRASTETYIEVYRSKTDEDQILGIDQLLMGRIMEYKKILEGTKEGLLWETRFSRCGKPIQGYFMFNKAEIWLYRLFKDRIPKLISSEFDITPSLMRKAAITEQTGEKNIVEAAKLANHKDISITRKHYLTMQQEFGSKPEEEKE